MRNSLPDAVVNLSTINQFKNRLDRRWSKQEMMYNYKGALKMQDRKMTDQINQVNTTTTTTTTTNVVD